MRVVGNKKPRIMPGLSHFRSCMKSVLRDDRSAKAIVDADLGGMNAGIAGRIGFDGASKRGTRHSGLRERLARSEVEIFSLDAPVIGQGVFDARASRPGNLGAGVVQE